MGNPITDRVMTNAFGYFELILLGSCLIIHNLNFSVHVWIQRKSYSKKLFGHIIWPHAIFFSVTMRIQSCIAEYIPLDPTGVDLFILAFQRFEGHVAFLGRGTPPFPQTYFCSVANNFARQTCPGRQVIF